MTSFQYLLQELVRTAAPSTKSEDTLTPVLLVYESALCDKKTCKTPLQTIYHQFLQIVGNANLMTVLRSRPSVQASHYRIRKHP